MYWFYIFNLYNFIFRRLISVYFLWFDYWTFKEWKTAKVQNRSVAAYQLFTQMIGPLLDMFTAAVYFSSGKFLNVCKPRTTTSPLTAWSTWIGILWKCTSMLTRLAGDGECSLALFHAIRNFLANKIYHFSRLSQQTDFLLGQPAPYNQLLIQ